MHLNNNKVFSLTNILKEKGGWGIVSGWGGGACHGLSTYITILIYLPFYKFQVIISIFILRPGHIFLVSKTAPADNICSSEI